MRQKKWWKQPLCAFHSVGTMLTLKWKSFETRNPTHNSTWRGDSSVAVPRHPGDSHLSLPEHKPQRQLFVWQLSSLCHAQMSVRPHINMDYCQPWVETACPRATSPGASPWRNTTASSAGGMIPRKKLTIICFHRTRYFILCFCIHSMTSKHS